LLGELISGRGASIKYYNNHTYGLAGGESTGITLEPKLERLVLPIERMDCADCTRHVQQAIAGAAGVQ
jgi:hypothetical protein